MSNQANARSIGCYIKEKLEESAEGKVMGLTSNGVFLIFGKHSAFLTTNEHESPFNIVLSTEELIPAELSIGDPVVYSKSDLLFPSRDLTINLKEAAVWNPANPLSLANSPLEQTNKANTILKKLLSADPQKGFLFLSRISTNDTPEQKQIRQFTRQFSRAFQQNDSQNCLRASTSLFGLGGGLTPSGDDWITGFLLYQCCLDLAQNKPQRTFITNLGAELLYTAYRQTTWVSANRLEAALKGWSEGLFLSAIDFLFNSSSADPTKIADHLLSFGHSSGVDTFVGIAFACQTQKLK
ncbi:MAG: DUF2877 domain-containing protein [Anaerolineaceae bacterium]